MRYYFPIFHKGETQADDVGELFHSAELAIQYGARVARDIASDPDHDRASGTVVIVVDASGAEIARHRVGEGGRKRWR
jgi:Mg-chelatase subunit ChlD